MEEPEVLMHLRPQTTQEKLLWERQSNKLIVEENKTLADRNAQLEAGITELKEKMKKEQIGALIIKNHNLKNQLEEKDAKLKSCKKEQEVLMKNLVRLQQTGSISDPNKGNSPE